MTALSPERQATSILRKTGVTSAPIPVHLVAQRLGLVLEAGSFGDDVSGVLVINGDRAVIGYNASHSPTRALLNRARDWSLYPASSRLQSVHRQAIFRCISRSTFGIWGRQA